MFVGFEERDVGDREGQKGRRVSRGDVGVMVLFVSAV